MTVNSTTYNSDKKKFFNKHNRNFYYTETSPMTNNGWHKEYIFADGAIWYEVYSAVYEDVKLTGESHGVQITRNETVKFFRTEYYSTDDATSKYLYEIY